MLFDPGGETAARFYAVAVRYKLAYRRELADYEYQKCTELGGERAVVWLRGA